MREYAAIRPGKKINNLRNGQRFDINSRWFLHNIHTDQNPTTIQKRERKRMQKSCYSCSSLLMYRMLSIFITSSFDFLSFYKSATRKHYFVRNLSKLHCNCVLSSGWIKGTSTQSCTDDITGWLLERYRNREVVTK